MLYDVKKRNESCKHISPLTSNIVVIPATGAPSVGATVQAPHQSFACVACGAGMLTSLMR